MSAYLWVTLIVFVLSAIGHARRIFGDGTEPTKMVTSMDLMLEFALVGWCVALLVLN